MSKALLLITLVLGALNAGFFFTWSFTVFDGLNALTADAAMAAMNAINAHIRSASFAVVFFGTPVLALLTTISLFAGRQRFAALLSLGGLVGFVATVVITATVHIPLNETLMTAPLSDAASLWPSYVSDWVSANHLRFGTSLLGLVALAMAWRQT